jgi:hypothetical protein
MALDKIGENAELQSETDPKQAVRVLTRNWDRCLREVFGSHTWSWARRKRSLSQVDSQSDAIDMDGVMTGATVPFAFVDASDIEVVRIAVGGAETVLTTDDYALSLDEGSGEYIVTPNTLPSAGEQIRITVTTSREGWEHVYQLPEDCVTPIALLGEDERIDLLSVEDRIEFAIEANNKRDGKLLCCDIDDDDLEALEYTAVIDNPTVWSALFVDAVAWRLAAELALSIKKDKALQKAIMDPKEGDYTIALERAQVEDLNIGHTFDPVSPSLAVRGATRPVRRV